MNSLKDTKRWPHNDLENRLYSDYMNQLGLPSYIRSTIWRGLWRKLWFMFSAETLIDED